MSVTQLPVHRRATTIAQTPALAALAGGGNVSARAGDRAHEAWNAHTYGTSGAPKRRNKNRGCSGSAGTTATGRAGSVLLWRRLASGQS